VELNNEVRELELKERDEERRILAELSAQIGEHADELKYGVENLAVLDLAFAKAKYADELRASEPILKKEERGKTKEETHPSSFSFQLFKARHPLLNPETVVPINFNPQPGTRSVVITGPNTGGKTVSLKTVGLLVLMAQSGLHIPVESGSELPFFHSVWADIGDEQSIEQSLSTFSGHITNIIHILKKADNRSLVILDELGAGTDPQEGASLARSILTHLLERGMTSLIATHYPELKAFAHSTEGVVNASLEFDIATLRPTYKLTLGLPGRSNALLIAQRLGLDPEIVSAAKADINPDNLRADKLLDDIRKERNRTSREREKLEKARAKLEAQTKELEKRLEKIEDERREVLAKARAEGELEIAVLKRNMDSLKSQLKNARQPLDAIKKVEEKIGKIEEKTEAPVARQPKAVVRGPSINSRQPLKLGERVIVGTLNAEGMVTALGESDAEVQIGSVRLRAKLSDLSRRSGDLVVPSKVESQKPTDSRPSTSDPRKSPGLELDLRGQMADDAIDKLERYLEQAYLTGLPWVRIIHGKGTGKLRQAVRDMLRGHAYVSSFEEGGDKEGGAGVTVAMLKAG
jgi:DNA mismatch repair protein MutS2